MESESTDDTHSPHNTRLTGKTFASEGACSVKRTWVRLRGSMRTIALQDCEGLVANRSSFASVNGMAVVIQHFAKRTSVDNRLIAF